MRGMKSSGLDAAQTRKYWGDAGGQRRKRQATALMLALRVVLVVAEVGSVGVLVLELSSMSQCSLSCAQP